MIVSLQPHRLQTLDQILEFVSSGGEAGFRHTDRASAYEFCRLTLVRFRYLSLGRRDKGTVRSYLAEVDAALGQMCGHATRAVMRRMFEDYGDERFERLASISNGHFYNLRNSTTCRRRRTTYRKTSARKVQIAERRKPEPEGRPGFVRVDTVDQGEKDGEKGVFHINLVDEVTQWEHVGTARAISESCLLQGPEGEKPVSPRSPAP